MTGSKNKVYVYCIWIDRIPRPGLNPGETFVCPHFLLPSNIGVLSVGERQTSRDSDRERQRENSNSKTLILEYSSVKSSSGPI